METKKRMMKKRLNKTRNKEKKIQKYINKIKQFNSSIYLYIYILNKLIKKKHANTLLYIYV